MYMTYLCFSWISSLSDLGKIDWKLTECVSYFNWHCLQVCIIWKLSVSIDYYTGKEAALNALPPYYLCKLQREHGGVFT